jgi:hypothetical protein
MGGVKVILPLLALLAFSGQAGRATDAGGTGQRGSNHRKDHRSNQQSKRPDPGNSGSYATDAEGVGRDSREAEAAGAVVLVVEMMSALVRASRSQKSPSSRTFFLPHRAKRRVHLHPPQEDRGGLGFISLKTPGGNGSLFTAHLLARLPPSYLSLPLVRALQELIDCISLPSPSPFRDGEETEALRDVLTEDIFGDFRIWRGASSEVQDAVLRLLTPRLLPSSSSLSVRSPLIMAPTFILEVLQLFYPYPV